MISEGTCCVSVVVPTFKRPEMLTRCLMALMAQDFEAMTYEVIIVDDAACDETRREVEAWSRRMASCGRALRYVPVQGAHGPAAARNAGWRAASGEIIAFTDDDCVPTPGWLRAGVAAFHEGVIGVAGRLIVPLSSERCPTDYERNAAQLATAQFVTANCFYRRFCLAAVGGFDERFTAAWREDSDLIFTLREWVIGQGTWRSQGSPLLYTDGASLRSPLEVSLGVSSRQNRELLEEAFVYAPEAVVVHPLRPAPWGVSLSQQRKSMFNALLYKKHPVLYREKIQAAPPWHYYGIVGALLALLGGVLGKNARVVLGASGLWLWLTRRFCSRRLQGTSHEPEHVAEMVVTSVLIPPLAIFWRIWGAIKFRVFFW